MTINYLISRILCKFSLWIHECIDSHPPTRPHATPDLVSSIFKSACIYSSAVYQVTLTVLDWIVFK
jgi:hypothetical protein